MIETKPDDVFARYRHGITHLLERLGDEHPRYADALTYQQRLVENLALAERDGDTESRRADRSAVITALNDLALETLATSFNALCGLDERPAPEAAAAPPRGTYIDGDGNAVGNGNVSVVAKSGGTVNFNLWVDAAEMFIEALKKLEPSDDAVVVRLLKLMASCGNNPRFSQPVRRRAVEAGLKIKDMTLVQIRVDRELLALIGMFLVGDFAKDVIQALRRDREERGLPPVPEPAPAPQPSKKRSKPAPRRAFEPELVFVPAGKFLMGTSPREVAALRRQFEWAKDYDYFTNEQPQHPVDLPGYYIGKYPVTNAQYRAFVRATGHRAPWGWDEGRMPGGKEEHPVRWLTWDDAVAYCAWLAEVTGKSYRLPTEAEWEKAARGTQGRIYPWGDRPPTAQLCNFGKNVGDTTPVGRYSPQGDSLYGCADMAGNVREWTSTRWGPDWSEPKFTYPYRYDAREDMDSRDLRVLRGGGYYSSAGNVRCALRIRNDPGLRIVIDGFRVARGSLK